MRTFSAFPEGTSFAILFGNTFASLIDDSVAGRMNAKKDRAEAKASGTPAPDKRGKTAVSGKEAAK